MIRSHHNPIRGMITTTVSPSFSRTHFLSRWWHLQDPPFQTKHFTTHFELATIPLAFTRNPTFANHFIRIPALKKSAPFASATDHNHSHGVETVDQLGRNKDNNLWAAVSLIIGTAVGPGMLGLPAETIKSGTLPSTLAILLSWVYVISSIILVAELSYVTMEEDGVEEVSFTGLATKAFGTRFGAFVSLIYASLSFSLMVACVSGIGSIVSQCFPSLHSVVAHALLPLLVGSVICFFPFNVIDASNRFLCALMLFFITTLVGIGLSVARTSVLGCFGNASWQLSSVLPAIPVAVLTLGFHVVTPFVCKIAGKTVNDGCRAILLGGSVPLVMVLCWNFIILGLVGLGRSPSMGVREDPISLLLSVKSSALFAVQGFAFSALATSLIGYAVSFPKQLIDTLELVFFCPNQKSALQIRVEGNSSVGRVGFGSYSGGQGLGCSGMAVFNRLDSDNQSRAGVVSAGSSFSALSGFVLSVVLIVPIVVASFYQSTFSRALDFAGVYINCFLFGILPPLMTYSYKAKKQLRSSILPGGDVALFVLFIISVVLGIWR